MTAPQETSIGLDYFGFHYMSAAQGRFTGPVPMAVTPARMLDPQRFKLYVYGRNNPLKFVDLDGRDAYLANQTEEERLKALYSITKNLTTREQRNIRYRKNAQEKCELYVRDASKVDASKASEGYQQLTNRIGNRDLHINFTLDGYLLHSGDPNMQHRSWLGFSPRSPAASGRSERAGPPSRPSSKPQHLVATGVK